ncbi:MAG: hypothetical protein ACTHNG_13115 [Ginsengibacter sp.]
MIKLKLIGMALAVCLIAACNSNNNEPVKNPPEEEVTDTVSAETPGDSMRTIVNRSMIWTVQPQDSSRQKLRAPDSTQIKTMSSTQLIDLLNQSYPDIHLDFIKISHDTIYVKIPDSSNLTNDIGDTGAENYLASTTYTLTEMKNIRYVNIAMKGGDHAEPGVYSRDDFKDLR